MWKKFILYIAISWTQPNIPTEIFQHQSNSAHQPYPYAIERAALLEGRNEEEKIKDEFKKLLKLMRMTTLKKITK